MAKKIIDIGTAPNSKNGDPLRTAFDKINDNFTELYAQTGDDIQIPAQATHTGKVLTTNGTALSWGTISGGGGGLSISDFGRGFANTLDSGKITTNKLYNRPANLALNNHYELSVTNGGVVTLPDGSIINGATLKTIPGNYAGITAGPASPAGKDEDSWVWVDNNGATISTKTSTDNHTWTFDNNGTLTLPEGSYIDETAAPLGTAKSLDLHPGNPGYPNQYLKIYPTVSADADHLHLTSGDLTATELFLGDDEQYVKLTNTGNVEIRTGAFDSYNDTRGLWTFDSNGALTLPTRNATPGSRIKSAVDITIETGPYYLVDLHEVGSGSVTDGIGTLDFLISSAPDWETQVAVGDHVVSGTWTDIIIAVGPVAGDDRWTVTFASGLFTGSNNKWSFYKPGADGGSWTFAADGDLYIAPGNTIRDAMTGDDRLRYYDPDDTDHWNEPAINTISAALDELAARVTAFENYEIDGGNAYTPAVGELLIDGNGD